MQFLVSDSLPKHQYNFVHSYKANGEIPLYFRPKGKYLEWNTVFSEQILLGRITPKEWTKLKITLVTIY